VRIAICWLTVLLLIGCGEQRSLGKCAAIGAIAGAAVGAGTVMAVINESTPDVSNLPYPATQREDHRVADWELYGGLAAGLAGALLGAAAGYYLCNKWLPDEQKQYNLASPSKTAESHAEAR
jgi:hypothetical protein